MSTTAASFDVELSPTEHVKMLFEELAELTGQRNAIDSRVVEIVAEMDRDELCGMTGARSITALVAWKTGTSHRNAETVVAIAQRLNEFPRLAAGMREGRLSLDQVGVIAERAADGSDEHYAELAAVATVSQLRTAVKLEPRSEPETPPEPQRSITKITGPGEDTPPGRSGCRVWKRRSSRPPTSLTATRRSPTGNATTTPTTNRARCLIRRRRSPTVSMRS